MPRTVMLAEMRNRHILDTSAWNKLFLDPECAILVGAARSLTILPTCVAITEIAAIEDATKRVGVLRLMKELSLDNRPIASPNQLMIMACEGYAKRARSITLNAGSDAEGAWVALNKPQLVDDAAQRMALDFNREREGVLREFNEGLRQKLQPLFVAGTPRPRTLGALVRHYSRDDNFLYAVVNPIYERAVANPLAPSELWPLLNSLYEWPMFLMGYACAIYQRAVQEQGYGHKNNPGHLDLWSAVYLPISDVFVTDDRRQRRALKILNKANPRPAQVLSYMEWRQRLLG